MPISRFIRYRHWIYGAEQTRPQLASPKGEAPPQAAAPQPPAEHSANTAAQLRAAIREIAAAREVNQISTRKVLLALIERKGEPWPALWGRDIARGNLRGPAAKLARLLQPSGIIPQTIREDGTTSKGYKLSSFDDPATCQKDRLENDTTTQGA
jgi:hypothetical protein